MGRVEVVSVAVPPMSVTDPSDVDPSWKVTIPSGVAVPLDCFTVAVRVTVEFSWMLVAEAVRVVAVPTCRPLTVTAIALEVDGLKEAVPA